MQNVQIIKAKKPFLARVAAVGAAVGSMVVASNSHALLAAADVTAATTAAGADDALKTGALWVLGIVIGIAVVGKIISMVKK